MPNNLYAVVGNRSSHDVMRVQVSLQVQGQLSGLFQAYEDAFRAGIDEELPFSRDWKADDDELLTLPLGAQVTAIVDQIANGPLAMQAIDPAGLDGMQIRALIFAPDDVGARLLVQYFSAAQQLSRRGLSLIADGQTFTRLTAPAFSVGTRIDAVIEGGFVKFKNFTIIKRIFDFIENYVEASDEQIENFSNHDIVSIEDVEAFKSITNQTTRKLISAVSSSGILDQVDINDIGASANSIGLNIRIDDGKIVFPMDKSELKILLRFLDHGVYQSPLIGQRFVANSKRPI